MFAARARRGGRPSPATTGNSPCAAIDDDERVGRSLRDQVDVRPNEDQRRGPDRECRLPLDDLPDLPDASAQGPDPDVARQLTADDPIDAEVRQRHDAVSFPRRAQLDRGDHSRGSRVPHQIIEERRG